MHWNKRDLDAVAADTRYMDYEERAAWEQLHDLARKTERPLPKDRERLYLLIGARKKSERRAVDTILRTHFEEKDFGWISESVEQEIEHCSRRSQTNAGNRKNKGTSQRTPEGTGTNRQNNGTNTDDRKEVVGTSDFSTSTLQDSNTSSLQEQLPAGAPPAVEFPSGFPKTEAEAVGWVRGGAVIIDRPDDWIRQVWHQVIGQGFKAGNGVLISHWASYLNARQHKGDDSFSEAKHGNSPQKKEGAGRQRIRVQRDETLPEPPCDWRALLKEAYPPEQYDSADYTMPWGLYDPEQRRELVAMAKGRGLLPADWKQPEGTVQA